MSLNIRNLSFKNKFTNASGILSEHPYLLKAWEESGIGAIITKSITLREKLPNYFSHDQNKYLILRGQDYTINSLGLHNKGSFWWKKELKKYKFSIPLIISVASVANDIKEYQKIMTNLEDFADGWELNISCPNIIGKEPIAHDLDLFEDLLSSLKIITF